MWYFWKHKGNFLCCLSSNLATIRAGFGGCELRIEVIVKLKKNGLRGGSGQGVWGSGRLLGVGSGGRGSCGCKPRI